MSNEGERASLADRAREVLENEAFLGALERLEEHYLNESIDGGTPALREEARMYVRLIRALPGHFQAVILDGAVAKKTLENWNS